MSTNLDFSTGKEHRVSVQIAGWTREDKASLVVAAKAIPGVVDLQSAGGGTSYYVSFNPSLTSEGSLRQHLTAAAERVLGVLPPKDRTVQTEPASITMDREHVTIDGGTFDFDPSEDTATVASSWTGIADIRERIAAVKQLAPVAIVAIDTLILELDVLGDNGGPALEERQEALDALRGLHFALGSLLALAETPNFMWADNEGLASECVGFAARAQKSLRDDPLPFATASLILAICTALHFPGAGALLANFAFSFQKQGKH